MYCILSLISLKAERGNRISLTNKCLCFSRTTHIGLLLLNVLHEYLADCNKIAISMALYSLSGPILPSFLLTGRQTVSFWYLYASLISLRLSLTNNPSPLQSMTFSPNNNNNNNNNNHNQLTRVLYSTYFCQFVCLFVISPRCNKSITVPSVHYFTKSAFRSITEFLECNCMTFFSAGCALATYWPRSLYCKLLSTAQRSGLRASAPFNHHNNLEFCNLWLLTIFQLTTKLSL